VPSNRVREVLPALSQGHSIEHSYLGVTTAPHARGAEVVDVAAGSPAQSAGLRSGDVITGVGGHEVTEPQDVSEAVNALKPGDRLELEVSRNGDRRTVQVELAARPRQAP
jgi:S1-C subfamily serine protease